MKMNNRAVALGTMGWCDVRLADSGTSFGACEVLMGQGSPGVFLEAGGESHTPPHRLPSHSLAAEGKKPTGSQEVLECRPRCLVVSVSLACPGAEGEQELRRRRRPREARPSLQWAEWDGAKPSWSDSPHHHIACGTPPHAQALWPSRGGVRFSAEPVLWAAQL